MLLDEARSVLKSSARNGFDNNRQVALHINMLYRNDVLALGAEGRIEAEINQGSRHAAVKSYIHPQYGRRSYQDMRIVSSCVINFIRRKYHDPTGDYTGFTPVL